MKPINITNESFENEVINSPSPVLLAFRANWCATCRFMRPVFFQLGEAGIKVAIAEYDNCKEIADKYHISTLPTIVYIKDGKPLFTHHGYIQCDAILKLIEEY